ncbi:aldo/keto reductase [Streptomyces sp. H27-G5]|uniref:aldo/keto reductase n=1 Tax=Streptomyces sp. H27-G5 TaxID=2996698 RepID=UPI00226E8C88|nr:aldo/keto reductase [Streptomyces sp. H27-G5]MCY0924157.1 aldo/keto reductase [Streptomyces sp. H27-G5]
MDGATQLADVSPSLATRVLDAGLCSFDLHQVAGPWRDARSAPLLRAIRRNRNDVQVSATPTSSPFGAGSRKNLITSVDHALASIQSDYLDILFVRRPIATVPLEETLDCLTDLVHRGKILHIGLCGHPPLMLNHTVTLLRERGITPSIHRFPYSLVRPWRIGRDTARYHGLGVIADPPPMTYDPQDIRETIAARELLHNAEQWHMSPEHLNLSWLWSCPETVSVVIDATPELLEDTLTALRRPPLTAQQVEVLHHTCAQL